MISDFEHGLNAQLTRLEIALETANDLLLLIADDATEDIGTRIDEVRAYLKDAISAK